jgi:hypothetical protein
MSCYSSPLQKLVNGEKEIVTLSVRVSAASESLEHVRHHLSVGGFFVVFVVVLLLFCCVICPLGIEYAFFLLSHAWEPD